MSLTDKINNLHLLLRVPSFSRWPLQVQFFCVDAYQAWRLWNERVNGSIRGGINISLDLKQPEAVDNDGEVDMSTRAKGKRKREALGKGGIEGLDVGYSELKGHVQKGVLFLAKDEALACAICAKDLGSKTAMTLLCPREDCRTASHMSCLAAKFIEDEGTGAAVTPISGRCPGCSEELQWIDLIKELSLRVRGAREVARMMKKLRVPVTKNAAASHHEAPAAVQEDATDPSKDLDYMRAPDDSDDSLPEDWHCQDDNDDDMMSVMSGHSAQSDGIEAASSPKRFPSAPKLPAVIEDSDWDDAELLD